VYGNILAGGLIGWGVDSISGAEYNLSPKTINVTLKVNTSSAPPVAASESSAAKFIDELKRLDEMHVAKTITDEEYAKMRTSLVAKYGTN
jgi:fructose-bisphosphate aldolase class 1